MALTNAYATVAEVRDHLGDSSSLLDLDVLERAINGASRAIDTHCRRGVTQRTGFWQDSSTAIRTYILDSAEVCYVDDISTRTGVVVKTGSDGITFGTTLTVDTDYILEPRNADKFASATFDAYAFWKIRFLNQTLTIDANRPTLQVTARHGWSAVPPEVNEACILKSASLFKRKDAPFGVAGFGEFGAVRIGRSDPDVIELLHEFRQNSVLVG